MAPVLCLSASAHQGLLPDVPRVSQGSHGCRNQVGADMNAKDDREYTAVAHAEATVTETRPEESRI